MFFSPLVDSCCYAARQERSCFVYKSVQQFSNRHSSRCWFRFDCDWRHAKRKQLFCLYEIEHPEHVAAWENRTPWENLVFEIPFADISKIYLFLVEIINNRTPLRPFALSPDSRHSNIFPPLTPILTSIRTQTPGWEVANKYSFS